MNLRIKLDLVGSTIKLNKNNSLGEFYKFAEQSNKQKMKKTKIEKLPKKLEPNSCQELIRIK